MSRSKRSAAGREPVTEATLRTGGHAYVVSKLAYQLAFSELWSLPPDRGSLAANTAVVLLEQELRVDRVVYSAYVLACWQER